MADRYYAPQLGHDASSGQLPQPSAVVKLSGNEAHHLLHVCRGHVDQEVTLFDGQGCEYTARVVALDRREVMLEILARRVIDREAARRVTLAVALPKGERQTWLVEKAVELGVAALVPLRTERGVAQPSEAALERLRRTVIEASKQCGRNRLLEISAPQEWGALSAAQQKTAAWRLFADPAQGRPLGDPPRDEPTQPLMLAVGPEGGWSANEVQQALDGGWQAMTLGPRILRVETAALALAAWALLPRRE